MRRTIPLIAAVAALALPAAAHADYFISRSEARSDVRDFVSDHYGISYGSISTYCRAQYVRRPDYRRYDYHRYICGWSDGQCRGAVRITGHTGSGYYGALVLRGARCAW